jgi:tryptophanyl-tRNA synthetase
MRQAYADGIAWGEAKQRTFELIDRELAPARSRYEELMAEPARIEDVLLDGARKARAWATPFLARIREAVGIRRLA